MVPNTTSHKWGPTPAKNTHILSWIQVYGWCRITRNFKKFQTPYLFFGLLTLLVFSTTCLPIHCSFPFPILNLTSLLFHSHSLYLAYILLIHLSLFSFTIKYTLQHCHIMERGLSISSRKINPPKESRKSATPSGTHTSNIPQLTGPNTDMASTRCMFIST